MSIDVSDIYLAKCKDLGITPTSDRENRFFEVIRRNCSGTIFDLRDHGVGEHSGDAIARYLEQKPDKYGSLFLGGNVIRSRGAHAIAKLLMVNNTLTSLDLRSNDIDSDGGIALFKALTHSNCTLTFLDLSGMSGVNRNHIGIKGAEYIGVMLSQNQVLNRLYLSENGFGVEGVHRICDGLIGNIGLETLDLGSNSLGVEGSAILANAIIKSSLKEVLVTRNHIGDGGAAHLSTAITTSPHLTSVDLSSNNIGPRGARYLGEALEVRVGMVKLDLGKNELGPLGAKFISEALKSTISLTTLILQGNSIDNKGALDIADALRRNTSLTKFDLSCNRVSDDGVTALSEALRYNSRMLHFDLSSNKIGDEGGISMAELIYHNRTLQHLALRNNSMQDVAGERIARSLQNNKTLLSLDVGFNDFSYRNTSEIERRIHQNLIRYKKEATTRYKQEIAELLAIESRLTSAQNALEQERAVRVEKESLVAVSLQALELAEEKTKVQLSEIQETLGEKNKTISKCEARQNIITREISRIKTEGETKFRNLAAKVHKDKDTNLKFEKRLRMRILELDEMKQMHNKEIFQLQEQLKLELFDRRKAENDFKEVSERLGNVVEQLKAYGKQILSFFILSYLF
eukprot:TRINITY_DN8463_c0_g1_i2.p1 TRINITY_DN8463_c0_g1~~TRINITY_DN8463_c0_g1_i2.p1  ORF type:complete len:630 (-),score=129.55 TRINITY_DN8463_c0_g1_i2:117-2006(-)